MLSVYLYTDRIYIFFIWIEFYTITLIHPEFNFFFCPRSSLPSALKILFHSCSKESSLNWAQALGNLCSNKKRETWAIQDIFALDSFSTRRLWSACYSSTECVFLSLTLAVKLKFLQSTQIQLGIFFKAVVSLKVLYFSAEGAVIAARPFLISLIPHSGLQIPQTIPRAGTHQLLIHFQVVNYILITKKYHFSIEFPGIFPLFRTVYYWDRTGHVFQPGCAVSQIALKRPEFGTSSFIKSSKYQICYKKHSTALSPHRIDFLGHFYYKIIEAP